MIGKNSSFKCLPWNRALNGEHHHAHIDSPGVPNVELVVAPDQVRAGLAMRRSSSDRSNYMTNFV